MKLAYKVSFIIMSAAYLSGCSDAFSIFDSSEIKMVKSGVLQLCPSHTVEQMVNGFMGSPSWDSGKSDDGKTFVNIDGDITFHDKPVRAMVQFTIDGNNFAFNAFEMNGVPSENIIAIGLLHKMCESAVSEPVKEAKSEPQQEPATEVAVESQPIALPEAPTAQEVIPTQEKSDALASPSFDCKKASTNIEKQICSSQELSKLDHQLSDNYKSMISSNIGSDAILNLKSTQKSWLSTRNKCADTQCIADEYKKRSNEICENYPVISGVFPECITYE